MVTKKHTGITFTLIGILLPIFGSVCLASTTVHNPFFSSPNHQYEKLFSLQENDVPVSGSLVKKDVDFIHRLKNERFISKKLLLFNKSSLNHLLRPEFFPAFFFLVPKPGYYDYLFLFKPF